MTRCRQAPAGTYEKRVAHGLPALSCGLIKRVIFRHAKAEKARFTKVFDENLTKKIQELAILAHKTCACRGVSRVDFLVHNNIPYILEINTNPGMTDTSDLPAQANEMGINYNELVEIILKTAQMN